MKAKDYLKLIKEWDGEISRLEAMIAIYRDQAEQITSQLSTAPNSGSHEVYDSMAESVARYVDKTRELCDAIDAKMKLRAYIAKQIEDMQDVRHKEVLFMRYVQGQSWNAIAEALSYSEVSIFRLHREALLAFEEKYKKFLNS